MSDGGTIYDLAFSFAGEQRDYVAQVVEACKRLGLNVFYDRDMNNEWWGRNFIREQRKVYGRQTRYFVPFLSTEYLAKSVPMDEFSAAMMTAVKQGDGYVLPVLMGDVQVPADLLHPHIHYLRADELTPEELAAALHAKVMGARAGGQEPRQISTVVKEALEVRLPRVIPSEFSKYEELQASFDYLADQFQAAAPQLRSRGFVCTVRRSESLLAIRVERRGEAVYSLDISRGGSFGDDRLEFALGRHHSFSSGINGWATPYYDKEAGQPKLMMTDLSVLNTMSTGDRAYTKDELFQALWNRIVDELERLS